MDNNITNTIENTQSFLDNLPTLRDQFAMAAMQSFLNQLPGLYSSIEDVAHVSYKMADAMLEARKEGV